MDVHLTFFFIKHERLSSEHIDSHMNSSGHQSMCCEFKPVSLNMFLLALNLPDKNPFASSD